MFDSYAGMIQMYLHLISRLKVKEEWVKELVKSLLIYFSFLFPENKKYKSHGKYVTEKLLTKDDTDNEPSKDVTENVPKKVANENEPTKDVTENKSTNGVAENEPRKDENKNNPSRDVTENEPTKDEMVSKKVEALFYVGGSNTVALECNNKTQKKTLGKRIRDFFSCFPCMRKVRST